MHGDDAAKRDDAAKPILQKIPALYAKDADQIPSPRPRLA
jgi:hypothetical protein